MHIIFLIYFAKLELGKIFLAETDTSDQPLDEQTPTEYVVRVGGENVSVTKGEKTYSYYEAVISVLTTEDGSTTNTIEVKWGDVTGDDIVDSSDAIAALMNFAGYTESYTVNGSSITVGAPVTISIE